MATNRYKSTFKEGLRIDTGGGVPIGQKLMQDIHQNDFILQNIKSDASMRNVRASLDGEGRNRERRPPHKRNLEHELVIWAECQQFTFGSSITIGQGDARPSWVNFTYDFPQNAQGDHFFHTKHLPVVVAQFVNNPDMRYPPLILTLERIRYHNFKFSVHQTVTTGSLPGARVVSDNDKFWLSILAIGRKGAWFGNEDIQPLDDVIE